MLIKLAVQFLRCLKLVSASSDFGSSVLTSSKGYRRDRWVINIPLVSFVSDESVSEEEKPCITLKVLLHSKILWSCDSSP